MEDLELNRLKADYETIKRTVERNDGEIKRKSIILLEKIKEKLNGMSSQDKATFLTNHGNDLREISDSFGSIIRFD